MTHTVEIILILFLAVAALATLARRLGIPYPILLTLGGLALSFVPGLPHVALAPELVFLIFLPPILYAAAWFTSWRDFKANLRSIGLLSFGLVLATTVVVALVARALIPGLPWAAAFVLGAIVSPPDAAAATSVIQRLGVPRRIVTILEGESLINDATALVAYRFAVAAVVTGAFSFGEATLQLGMVAVGGVLIGLAIGFAVVIVEKLIDDSAVEIAVSFIAPIGAYLLAEELHWSGVLATVAAGLFVSRRASRLMMSDTRLRAVAVWDTVIFILNGLIFILIGLQLPTIIAGLSGRPLPQLLGYAVAISLTVILIRVAWVFPATYLPRLLSARVRARDPYPSPRNVMIVAYTGLRGIVSLATALALPLEVEGGGPFPERDLLLFLTFAVILATLVGQGLTLPWLIRRLGVTADGGAEQEEHKARLHAAKAVLARLEELAAEEWATEEAISRLRDHYTDRARHLADELGLAIAALGPHPDGHDHNHVHSENRLRRDLIDTERRVIIRLRDEGAIGDEVLHAIERDLDLEELRLPR
jgi:CPA1 family monovalent cation:H+ antiporter